MNRRSFVSLPALLLAAPAPPAKFSVTEVFRRLDEVKRSYLYVSVPMKASHLRQVTVTAKWGFRFAP